MGKKNGMTSSDQLAAYLQPRLGPEFLGVFSSDTLPPSFKRPAKMIANYSPAGTPGTHWVAMTFPSHGPAQYFSSYGLRPDAADGILNTHTQFRRYLDDHGADGWVASTYDLQALGDDECGEWSVWALLYGLPRPESADWAPFLAIRSKHQRDQAIRAAVGIRE